jgi:hypothetical protein
VLEPIDRLPRKTRDRLARFAEAFETLDAERYALFATKPLDHSAYEHARRAAEGMIGKGSRRDAIEAATGEFREYALRAYARFPGFINVRTEWTPVGNTEDRTRFLGTLETAVIALILWDELEPADREELLGPWAELAEPAALP